jgi:hypothetical protein
MLLLLTLFSSSRLALIDSRNMCDALVGESCGLVGNIARAVAKRFAAVRSFSAFLARSAACEFRSDPAGALPVAFAALLIRRHS